MTPDERILFIIGERLHMPASAVECLSGREVRGWMDYFLDEQKREHPPAPKADPDGDAIPLRLLNKAARRAAFHH